jgi:hypothetical protein
MNEKAHRYGGIGGLFHYCLHHNKINAITAYDNLYNSYALRSRKESKMDRDELKAQIEELMRQYGNEEIDGATYSQKMMELTSRAQNENND